MFFLALVLVGTIAWWLIPVELFPPIEGNTLFVSFTRPGSDPEAVEREILIPLESRASELEGVQETKGSVVGSSGSLQVTFRVGVDIRTRELELSRLASELVRQQPRGSSIQVSAIDTSDFGSIVMVLHVSGGDDVDALADFADDRIVPRIAALPGVAQAFVMGGAPQQAKITLSAEKLAAEGVSPGEVVASISNALSRLQFVGHAKSDRGQVAVLVDGRPAGLVSLGEIRVSSRAPVKLTHVASIDLAPARRESISRVNGKASVAVILFQEQGENLVRLGRTVREQLETLNQELAPSGIALTTAFDAADLVEDQIDRLGELARSGFLVAVLVLYLFLHQWRAVLVVAISVPVSLLIALGGLHLAGHSINMLSLFGLAIAVGLLVDNSIVVYEAMQHALERGADTREAAGVALARTSRAMLAATATNAIVFLPLLFVDLGDASLQELVKLLAFAIVLPQAISLLVALGLVPLLTRWFAAPAALRAVRQAAMRRSRLAGMRPPQRGRELFTGLLTVALRRPAGWLTAVSVVIVIVIVMVVPLLLAATVTREPRQADQIQLQVTLPRGGNLDRAQTYFSALEAEVLQIKGVKQVESLINEASGTLTIKFEDQAQRPPEFSIERVRRTARETAGNLNSEITIEVVSAAQSGGGGGGGNGDGGGVAALLGSSTSEIKLSGPDVRQLRVIADAIRDRLASLRDQGVYASYGERQGLDELVVRPDARRLSAYGLMADEVLPALSSVRREGVQLSVGFTLPDGREIPLLVRREEDEDDQRAGVRILETLPLSTAAGAIPLAAVADVRRMPAPPVIEHHNGRRELRIGYQLTGSAPESGPARVALEDRMKRELRSIERPSGYTIEPPSSDKTTSLMKKLLVPVVLLLFAVLAITFESLIAPVVVMLALPLTIVGAVAALLINGLVLDPMAIIGVVALLGITVNPAILLVDRMQAHIRTGRTTAGAAALAAVRERVRPVLMATATTVAGLWPLALVTGREAEIWPPFATVVIGGLVFSTLLTLLVIPIGFTLAAKLDRLFGRLGPWLVLGWIASVAAIMSPLILTGLIDSLTWQVITSLVVGGLLLSMSALFFLPAEPLPVAAAGLAPKIDVRFLHKTYGQPGPIGYAWRVTELFARRVLARGGKPFEAADAWKRVPRLLALAAAALWLAWNLESGFWGCCWLIVTAAATGGLFKTIRAARGLADPLGRPLRGGIENALALGVWWLAWPIPWWLTHDRDWRDHAWLIVSGLLIAAVQLGRRTARRIGDRELAEQVAIGRWKRVRTSWRRLARKLLGFDLPLTEVHAVRGVEFAAERGMIGVLGPNGAGKTTLLRILGGILTSTRGVTEIGGVRIGAISKRLARWVGYLPQDFGLPTQMSARGYLDYWALLYEVGNEHERRERVERLLTEVGLADRADEQIGNYSGGMRQRVAVARTLLRLPPIIIVDEPTVGLDPRERIRFRNLLARLAEGRIVLFSTHVVEDVEVACERVLVMSQGSVVFDGLPFDLASAARGKVWELRLAVGESPDDLPKSVMVSDVLPLLEGGTKLRLLSEIKPHPRAEPVEATLEDGYLLLVGPAARAKASA
jgi:multidrug efflux pump subunit AcrB/ABC-type multidrug transport system ATPase subunit